MGDVLLVTIPAVLVLVATLGARFVEHFFQSKRETGRQKLERERESREAKRKYRENIVAPVREELTKLHTSISARSLWDAFAKDMSEKDKKKNWNRRLLSLSEK